MITEYGGHMYPTKIYDQEQRQAEHVRRHLEVLNAAYGDPQISGAIGWCAFDYNTHKDFGSGDRICHHGVMDMFREPKFAAYVYASQCEPSEAIVFRPVTIWARGERNIGGVLPLTILTNCDEVELRTGKLVSKRFQPDRKTFPHLPHAPIVIQPTDLSSGELSLWGWVWLDAEIVGYIDGKQVASARFAANPVATTLEVVADTDRISAGHRDEVRVMVRALDQAGNKLPFMFDPVTISVSGPADLIGPSQPPLRGGATGFWLRSTGTRGKITASVSSQRFGTKTIELVAE
jgi:beta-galactosidase